MEVGDPRAEWTDFLTGRHGPLRRGFELLRRLGFGERMVKTAIAAFLAWEIGRLIPGNPHPYLAPLTAILVMQTTIAQSVTFAIQRGLGVAIGVIVALIAVETIGVHGWTIGVVVLLSLGVGARLRSGQQSTQQIAVTALLVMLLGSAANEFTYAGLRITDTIIGTVVAIAINTLFAPPSYLPTAEHAISTLGNEVGGVLDAIAASLRTGPTIDEAERNLVAARKVSFTLDATEIAIRQAQLGLKYHPFAEPERERLAFTLSRGEKLERVAIQIRVLARTTLEHARAVKDVEESWLAPERMGMPTGEVLAGCAGAVRAFARTDYDEQPGSMELAAAREALKRADDASRAQSSVSLPEDWVTVGELLAVSRRLLSELETDPAVPMNRPDPDFPEVTIGTDA